MSLIDAFYAQQTFTSYTPGQSVDIDSYDFQEQPSFEIPLSLLSTVGDLNRVQAQNFSREITAFIQTSFIDEFYDMIHVGPRNIDFGNIFDTTEETFYVWNAYRYSSKTLGAISVDGNDEGLNIVAEGSLPTVFLPTGEVEYTLVALKSGPINIAVSYTFVFPEDTPVLRVTGRRLVLWPFLPTLPHEERFEHNTDVQRTVSGESRISLLNPARQIFKYSFALDPQEFSRAKAVATQWSHRLYGVPVWTESRNVASIGLGATTISVNTSLLDYRANGFVFIWKNSEEFDALEILSVQSNQLTLKFPSLKAWSNVRVMPMRFAYTPEGVTFDRSEPYIISAKADFLVDDNKYLGASYGFPTYRGKQVYSLPNLSSQGIQERILRSVDIIDNGTGPVVLEDIFNYADHKQEVSIYCENEAERIGIRNWMMSLRGKYGSFWLPSFNIDMVLVANAVISNTFFVVKSIGYSGYYTIKDIAVFLKNGNVYFYRATGATDLENGTEQINLSTTVGININITDVERISFMECVRLDTDVISIEHIGNEQAFIKAPVIEVPE